VKTTQTDAWVELAQSLGECEFVARHPGFFLISTEEPVELSTLYDTQVVDFGSNAGRPLGRRRFDVRWIAKAPDSPYPDRVSVGRARNCDVNFRHPSVSKLHAHLRNEHGRLVVSDRRSRNGTRVNGKLVAPDESRPLAAHDKVQFGSVSTLVLDGHELFDLLSRLV
jgi:hypothetical protein